MQHDEVARSRLHLAIFIENIFFAEKAFCFKTEIKISAFQDAGHNLNGSLDMSHSKFTHNYDL